jgi:aquaporin Z
VSEAIGTFWLTFGGCGSAVIAAAFPHVGIGLVGVSLAFGLTLLTMAYAIGHVSGCHINPAVTIGLAAGGRFPASQIGPYIAAQIVGAIIGAALLFVIARGAPDFAAANGFAANGYGEHSPGHYDLLSCFITEVVMTTLFLFIIMGSTHGRAPVGFAPIAIGLGLTLIHLVSIPVTIPRSTRRAASGLHCSPAAGLWASFGCSLWLPLLVASLGASSTAGSANNRQRRLLVMPA